MKYYIIALKNYANFNGRASEGEFWYFALFHMIFTFAPFALIYAFEASFIFVGFSIIISQIYSLATFLPLLAISVRRLHDVGKSGWYILIPVYSLILLLTDSNEGSNKYGNITNKSYLTIKKTEIIDSKKYYEFYDLMTLLLIASLIACSTYALLDGITIIENLGNAETIKGVVFFISFFYIFIILFIKDLKDKVFKRQNK